MTNEKDKTGIAEIAGRLRSGVVRHCVIRNHWVRSTDDSRKFGQVSRIWGARSSYVQATEKARDTRTTSTTGRRRRRHMKIPTAAILGILVAGVSTLAGPPEQRRENTHGHHAPSGR